MTLSRRTKITIGVTASVSVIVATLLVVNALVFNRAFKEEYIHFQSVKPGMSETEVLKLLGPPFKSYDKNTAPENYYIEGYSRKVRPITNKVLIYVSSEPIAYVYLDERSKVEEIFVGGS